MNYNELLEEDINKDFFYNREGYPKLLLINGYISLDKAVKRAEKGEYYVLVEYPVGTELPASYLPVKDDKIDFELPDGISLASFNPKTRVFALCENGGVQLISRLPYLGGEARYLRGSGPEQVFLEDLMEEQLQSYKEHTLSHTK